VSFDAVPGTRGRRVTTIRGPVGRWLTRLVVKGIRRTGKVPILGFNAVALTTIGAKSGLERTTPVCPFPGKDGSWLIVASAAGGRKNPAWYHNIAAHPGQVQIEAAGQKTAVVAEQLHGVERDQAWRRIITTTGPRYAKDADKTDRQLPIIRLVARAEKPHSQERPAPGPGPHARTRLNGMNRHET
jgi:deazaflavin-dependent oxidoreductase (nitroreductase family)